MTPMERILKLKSDLPNVEKDVDSIISSYRWFIERTQIPSTAMLNWISDKTLRNEAFNKSREFGDALFELLQKVDNQSILKKLLI